MRVGVDEGTSIDGCARTIQGDRPATTWENMWALVIAASIALCRLPIRVISDWQRVIKSAVGFPGNNSVPSASSSSPRGFPGRRVPNFLGDVSTALVAPLPFDVGDFSKDGNHNNENEEAELEKNDDGIPAR